MSVRSTSEGRWQDSWQVLKKTQIKASSLSGRRQQCLHNTQKNGRINRAPVNQRSQIATSLCTACQALKQGLINSSVLRIDRAEIKAARRFCRLCTHRHTWDTREHLHLFQATWYIRQRLQQAFSSNNLLSFIIVNCDDCLLINFSLRRCECPVFTDERHSSMVWFNQFKVAVEIIFK